MNIKASQIFLCHAKEDQEKVTEVYRILQEKGFSPWLDKENLLPGQKWEDEIQKAIKASGVMLIFFSKTSVSKRGFVQKEFKLGLDTLKEIPSGQIFIIPIRLDDCIVPHEFQGIHYVDLFQEGGVEKIIASINTSAGRVNPPAADDQMFVKIRSLPKDTSKGKPYVDMYVNHVQQYRIPFEEEGIEKFLTILLNYDNLMEIKRVVDDYIELTLEDGIGRNHSWVFEHGFWRGKKIGFMVQIIPANTKNAAGWYTNKYGGYKQFLDGVARDKLFQESNCSVFVHCVFGENYCNVGVIPLWQPDALGISIFPLTCCSLQDREFFNLEKVSLEKEIQELINELQKIALDVKDPSYSSSGYLYMGILKELIKDPRTREIGNRLNDLGGIKLMRSVHNSIYGSIGSNHARNLEIAWNGIGEWLS